jgi:hypothetical protein
MNGYSENRARIKCFTLRTDRKYLVQICNESPNLITANAHSYINKNNYVPLNL